MNIALGTLLIFLLIIPGIAYRKAYTFGSLTKKYTKLSAFDDFIWGIVPGVILQILGTLFVNKFHPFGYSIKLLGLGKIIFASDISEFGKIEDHLGAIFSYNLSLIVIATWAGRFLRRRVRYFNLDHHWRPLRFNNEWYYILRGEYIFFPETKKSEDRKSLIHETASRFRGMKIALKEIHLTRRKKGRKIKFPIIKDFFRRNEVKICTIHAVVKSTKGECIIYTGAIHSFYLAKDGSLDAVLIKGARRKPFDEEYSNYFTIPSIDILVLKNSEIVDISVNAFERLSFNPARDPEPLAAPPPPVDDQVATATE